MRLLSIKSEGLAHNSYYLSDDGEAAVIDPKRDCKIYQLVAEKECTQIKYILETHRNEDYVSGSLELQNITEAEIGHGAGLPFQYGEHRFCDYDEINVGSIKIKVLSTPGHTDESVSYAAYTSEDHKNVAFVFTGDTLFVGSVGRTDLYGKKAQQKQATKLFQSIKEKLLPLGDHAIIYPAHGAGSLCGGKIGTLENSTLGYEKKTNPYLALDEESFLRRAQDELLVVPKYFKNMETLNLNGAPLLRDLSFPKAMNVADFENHMKEPNVLVVDTRNPYAFAGSHIPYSLSLWLAGTSIYPGWIMPIEQYIIFVLEKPSDIKQVTLRFHRLGFDNICGYLCTGISEWQEAGKPFNTFKTLSAKQLKTRLPKKDLTLVDVREPNEWHEGYIESSKLSFFGELDENANLLPKNKPTAVICSAGNRSSIGASILEQKGLRELHNVLGGMAAWETLGYPTTRRKK